MAFDILIFFKQTTAYDMRISDWSSDVCSSDLNPRSRMGADLSVERGDIPLYAVCGDQDSRLGQVGGSVPPDDGRLLEIPGRERTEILRHPRCPCPEQRSSQYHRCPLSHGTEDIHPGDQPG